MSSQEGNMHGNEYLQRAVTGERMKDYVRQMQQEKLIREAKGGRVAGRNVYKASLVKVGKGLTTLGLKLQERYGEISRGCEEIASLETSYSKIR